jgi:hypothetical protein
MGLQSGWEPGVALPFTAIDEPKPFFIPLGGPMDHGTLLGLFLEAKGEVAQEAIALNLQHDCISRL